MSDKDKVDFLLKLADSCWRDYSERRSIEWKVNFGLWTGLGIFAGFVFQRQTALPDWLSIVVSTLLGCSFLVYTFGWKKEIQRRNRHDLNNAQYYWRQVDKELGTTPTEPRRDTDPGWRPTHFSQVLITFLFVLLVALAVWKR